MRIVLAGAGNLGREIKEFISRTRRDRVEFQFVDDFPTLVNQAISFDKYLPLPNDTVLVTIADPAYRSMVSHRLTKHKNVGISSWHHETSTVEMTSSRFNLGGIFMPYSLLSVNCSIGNGLIMNCYSSIGHDCVVGNYCTLSGYAGLGGHVTLGDCVFMGMGAIVKPGLKVGNNVTIGMGSIVTRDIPDRAVVMGNPARIIKYT